MLQYRVIDLRNPAIDDQERLVVARSPEAAVKDLFGIEVVRSGSRQNLVARAYWQNPNQPISMVRLYRRIQGPQPA